MSQLTLLTQLSLNIHSKDMVVPALTPADAFTALTASTNLCSLQLRLEAASNTPEHWVLFAPDTLYPHLRVINLAQLTDAQDVPIKEQQLQQLCSCCPAVQDLRFALCTDASPTALQPLLQLSALTQLVVYRVGAAGVLGVAAQLTGLKRLELRDIPCVSDPAVLQLTALTGLRQLSLWQEDMEELWEFVHEVCVLRNVLGHIRGLWTCSMEGGVSAGGCLWQTHPVCTPKEVLMLEALPCQPTNHEWDRDLAVAYCPDSPFPAGPVVPTP
jgi:hypothetical protein